MNRIKVSSNRRFLSREDGTPFFYLGDTVWELFHRYSYLEAETYLRDRASKGFTVVQAVVLAEFNGLTEPNPNGHLPLEDLDVTRLNEAYVLDVDHIVDRANKLGLVVGMLPNWGDKWNRKWGAGPEIFTPDNAKSYGRTLGERYRDADLIWILGGDRPIEEDRHAAIVHALAKGLAEGDGGVHLRTFHPMGGQTSSQYFHESEWLDFNMWQSGHDRNHANYMDVAGDYLKMPTKPCMDAEPGYEDHPAGFNIDNGFLDAYDCRKSIYWGLFAGALGHTYGCHPIWQKYQRGSVGITMVRTDWRDALNFPGSAQMQHARALIESRPYFSRIPDQSLIIGEPGTGSKHVQASRDENGRYAFIFLPWQSKVEVNLSDLSGDIFRAHWFDPRTGAADLISVFERQDSMTFESPHGGPDWVLVIDDAAQEFPRPGSTPYPDRD
jgi:hypothetical protein